MAPVELLQRENPARDTHCANLRGKLSVGAG
jgi:hypothetical protein